MEHFSNEFTTTFYLVDAAHSCKIMIRVLTEDTYVFVLLVCWVYQEKMECKMQMVRWDMKILGPASAVAWHPCPHQLRYDLILIHQSQDQCAKHLGH